MLFFKNYETNYAIRIIISFVFYFIQNTAYKGIDFMPFVKPKFLEDILIEYLGLYFSL